MKSVCLILALMWLLACGQQPNPDWRFVDIADLTEDDQRIWESDRTGLCPGIAEAQMDATHPSDFAITLIKDSEGGLLQWLVVLRREEGASTEVHALYGPDTVAAPSVIWRAPPGDFLDRESGSAIRTEGDVLVFEKLEAGSFVFFREGNEYRHFIASQ